jgi:hypothetical protein
MSFKANIQGLHDRKKSKLRDCRKGLQAGVKPELIKETTHNPIFSSKNNIQEWVVITMVFWRLFASGRQVDG